MFGPDYRDHQLIFCQPNGACYSPDRVGARVKELIVAVRPKSVSLRSPRNTFASELVTILMRFSSFPRHHAMAWSNAQQPSGHCAVASFIETARHFVLAS